MLCIFKAKFHWKSISFALIRPVFLTFSNRSYQLLFQQQYAQEMNQWQSIKISWPVPSFSQHNWRLVVSGRCLHVSVTKFQDTFARLQQVNSPNSWNKFQICCTDMYLLRFFPNFGGFRGFTWISRLRDRAKYQKPCLVLKKIFFNTHTRRKILYLRAAM